MESMVIRIKFEVVYIVFICILLVKLVIWFYLLVEEVRKCCFVVYLGREESRIKLIGSIVCVVVIRKC